MEIFKKINELLGEGCTLTINVAKKGELLVVGVMPGNPLVKDAAVKNLAPLNISGTAEELDEGFLASIEAPMSRATGLLVEILALQKKLLCFCIKESKPWQAVVGITRLFHQ